NWLLRVGIAGAFGWLGMIVVTLIPVVFPVREDSGEENARPALSFGKGLATLAGASGGAGPQAFQPPAANKEGQEKEKGEKERSVLSLFGYEFGELALVIIPVCVVGFVYSALLTLGAVKMQNLESRGWGMAASVMALLPVNIYGFVVLTALAVSLILAMFSDE